MDLPRRHVSFGVTGQAFRIIARAILKALQAVVGYGDFLLRRHFGYQRLISWLY